MTCRTTIFCLVAAFVVLTPGIAQWQLEAVLNGANEVPPVPSLATGYGYFTLNIPANTITYHVRVTGVAGTAAHLHVGAVGVANPAIFIGLTGGPTVWEGTTAALTTANVITLLTEGLYVNVHSAAFPGGEIRGQLVPARRSHFSAVLDQAQETPPTGSAATGTGRLRLNEPENRVIYDVKVSGMTSNTAHIHTGAAGVPGPVLVPLNGVNGVNPHYAGLSQVLTSAEVTQLKASGMYFNVHSVAFPGGEIRGQIIPDNQTFSAQLNGAQETPPVASAATGCARLDFNPTTNVLSYSVNSTPLPSGFLFAHIHTGVQYQAGPVMHTLIGGPTVFNGSVVLTAPQALTLQKGGLYFNIHSNAFPAGEIRGQIRPESYVFGYGGEGTGLARTRIDGYGYNGVTSHNLTISLTNAQPSAGVILFIAGNTTFWAAGGVPLPFTVAPHGTVWADLSLGFTVSLMTDTSGSTELTVPLPTDPIFDCFKAYLQCVSTDPFATPALVLSDAFELTILL